MAATPPTPSILPMCIIGGLVVNIDGTACARATVTFNSLFQQVIRGFAVQPLTSSRRTDSTGVLEPISLPQGLTVQVKVSVNGQTFAPTQGTIPYLPNASLNEVLAGVSP